MFVMGVDFKNTDWKNQLFPKRGNLPEDLTAFDILKSFAVVLMIIDHVGWLLFQNIEWFRVLGRLSVPIWFFLIGYSYTRQVPWRWYAAGVILAVSSMVVGLDPLPLSVLFTMAIIRYVLEPVWAFMSEKQAYFWWFVLLLAFFGYVSDMFIEYGTMGLLLALVGYLFKNRHALFEDEGESISRIFAVVALAAFGGMELLKFGFSMLPAMVLAAGLIGIYFVLEGFKGETLAGSAQKPHAPLLKFMGRYSLEIYVLHLLILKAVFGLKMLAGGLIG
ncbi:MAG: hypothetical protein EBQ96_06015 [Proteobacteria bacterium]|nr:hypothetical protein [Pseudomonadota bacterium]